MDETLCEMCGKEYPPEEIVDCACGVPFCDDCYEAHVTECEEANEAMSDEGNA